MDIKPKFEVSGRIARPVSDVFEAFVNPDSLSRYFTTGGAVGRIEQGATVTWDFQDFPGAFPVKVIEVEKDKRIVLKWGEEDERKGHAETTVHRSGLDAVNEGHGKLRHFRFRIGDFRLGKPEETKPAISPPSLRSFSSLRSLVLFPRHQPQ